MPVYAAKQEFDQKFNSLDLEEFAAWCISLQTPEQRESGGHQNVIYFSKLKRTLEDAGFVDVIRTDFEFTTIPRSPAQPKRSAQRADEAHTAASTLSTSRQPSRSERPSSALRRKTDHQFDALFDISHEISTMRVSKFSFSGSPRPGPLHTTCDVRNQATRMKIASELPAASAIFRNVPALENLQSCVFSTHSLATSLAIAILASSCSVVINTRPTTIFTTRLVARVVG